MVADTEKTGQGTSEKISGSEPSFFTLMHNAFIRHLTSGQQRRGQAWMNALADVDSELYGVIHGTDADCFYNDHKIPAFKLEVFGYAP